MHMIFKCIGTVQHAIHNFFLRTLGLLQGIQKSVENAQSGANSGCDKDEKDSFLIITSRTTWNDSKAAHLGLQEGAHALR